MLCAAPKYQLALHTCDMNQGKHGGQGLAWRLAETIPVCRSSRSALARRNVTRIKTTKLLLIVYDRTSRA